MKYVEVWSLEPSNVEIDYFNPMIIVGLAFIIYESIVLIARKFKGKNSTLVIFLDKISTPKYPYNLIFYPVGVISIVIGIMTINSSISEIEELKKELSSTNLETVEGVIEVEFEQPEAGHTDGDIIHIGNKTFEISTYFMSNFYHTAISNGGILTPGKNVRISYIPTTNREVRQYGDGKIAKIEIIK
jgi:hypothetical protein